MQVNGKSMKINASQWKIDENQCKSVEIDDFCLQIATKIRELEDWRIQWMGIRSRKLFLWCQNIDKKGSGCAGGTNNPTSRGHGEG